MIRKISKNNDYRDIIKSCPTGVIDDIHTIKYFIAGHPETEYEASFTKKGTVLEVILPSEQLQLLSSGVLMRRALYSDTDPSFPDGEYNLEFVDDLNVWLGEDEVDPPYDPGWLTEEDLKTINGETLVGTGNIDVVSFIPDYYATKSWVESQTSQALTGYATESWVSSQTSQALTGYATESWVRSQGYLSEHQNLSSYATQTWVESMVSQSLDGYATQTWVSSQTAQTLEGYATKSWVEDKGYLTEHQDLSSYATQSWVQSQGYITSENIPSGLATQSWVSSNFLSTGALTGYATQSWVSSNFLSATALTGYATQSWVSSNFLSATALTGYATQSWVSSQTAQALEGYVTEGWIYENGFITTDALEGYATESWVMSQGYLTSHQDLSSYATKSWVGSQGYATQSWVSDNAMMYDTSIGFYTSSVDVIKRSMSGNGTKDLLIGYSYWGLSSSRIDGIMYRNGYMGECTYDYNNGHWSLTYWAPFMTDSFFETVISSYATQNYVNGIMSEYATQSWVSSNYLEESKVWCGTQEQWNRLTSEEQATYKIALVTA